MTFVFISTIAVAACLIAQADTTHYRWTDKKGGTVYSDRPPPSGVDYEVVNNSTGLKRVLDGELEPQSVDVSSSESIKKSEALCERARDNLKALQGEQTVAIRNLQGDVKELTPEERSIEIQTARAQISVYCE